MANHRCICDSKYLRIVFLNLFECDQIIWEWPDLIKTATASSSCRETRHPLNGHTDSYIWIVCTPMITYLCTGRRKSVEFLFGRPFQSFVSQKRVLCDRLISHFVFRQVGWMELQLVWSLPPVGPRRIPGKKSLLGLSLRLSFERNCSEIPGNGFRV
jgi:hypothetical protein